MKHEGLSVEDKALGTAAVATPSTIERERNTANSADNPAPPDFGRTVAWLAKQVELGLADVGLSLPQYRVMWLLDAGPRLPSDIADRLNVRPPSVTAVVDGLVGRGLVDRLPTEGDRRQVTHVLTEAGRTLLAEADVATNQRLLHIANCLSSPSARARAFDGLEEWHEALLAHREQLREGIS